VSCVCGEGSTIEVGTDVKTAASVVRVDIDDYPIGER
jgi:hypothetical protein